LLLLLLLLLPGAAAAELGKMPLLVTDLAGNQIIAAIAAVIASAVLTRHIYIFLEEKYDFSQL
jgi:hypothetical protein